MMRLVCISDTHLKQVEVPDGDVLVHAGDFTGRGSLTEIHQFNVWLSRLPHQHKVVIAGNHDFGFQTDPALSKSILSNAIYLQDEMLNIEGKLFYGSPWQPWFHNWAFNLPRRGEELQRRWSSIPENIDVLITHGPPFGILDKTDRGEPVGCELLRAELDRVKPKVHVFGHIHEDYGQFVQNETRFINASTCNLQYKAVNPAVVIDLE